MIVLKNAKNVKTIFICNYIQIIVSLFKVIQIVLFIHNLNVNSVKMDIYFIMKFIKKISLFKIWIKQKF